MDPSLYDQVLRSPNKGQRKTTKRVILNREKAVEIYRLMTTLVEPKSYSATLDSSKINIRGMSSKVAVHYGVSPKAIRDIWNRKSWAHATGDLCDNNRRKTEIPQNTQQMVR
jgi:hypothetical protein